MPGREKGNDWQFRATPTFWKQFDKLPPKSQARALEKFEVFRRDPFDKSLRPHPISRLSAVWNRKIYAVRLEGDLRAVFYVKGSVVTSVAIGTHDIYRP